MKNCIFYVSVFFNAFMASYCNVKMILNQNGIITHYKYFFNNKLLNYNRVFKIFKKKD